MESVIELEQNKEHILALWDIDIMFLLVLAKQKTKKIIKFAWNFGVTKPFTTYYFFKSAKKLGGTCM